jgi:hypothetical protein
MMHIARRPAIPFLLAGFLSACGPARLESSAAQGVTATSSGSGAGTGTVYVPSHVTGVGAGVEPSAAEGISVQAFGAVGDGSTDDTLAIQRAADAASSAGKPLLIPATSSFYKIAGKITVRTSVLGTGSTRPTIRQTVSGSPGEGVILSVPDGSQVWIAHLHLVGTYSGGSAGTEWDHCVDLGNVDGVTIQDNVCEDPKGDCFGGDQVTPNGGSSKNVLITNNTCINPWRCGVAMLWSERFAVMNNVFDKQANYVSAIDFEPVQDPHSTTTVEVAYNKFVMNNRTPGRYGSDGRAASAWQNEYTTNPGGNLYLHHNYGTFGVGWWMSDLSCKAGDGDWYNIVQSSNVEGDVVPG